MALAWCYLIVSNAVLGRLSTYFCLFSFLICFLMVFCFFSSSMYFLIPYSIASSSSSLKLSIPSPYSYIYSLIYQGLLGCWGGYSYTYRYFYIAIFSSVPSFFFFLGLRFLLFCCYSYSSQASYSASFNFPFQIYQANISFILGWSLINCFLDFTYNARSSDSWLMIMCLPIWSVLALYISMSITKHIKQASTIDVFPSIKFILPFSNSFSTTSRPDSWFIRYRCFNTFLIQVFRAVISSVWSASCSSRSMCWSAILVGTIKSSSASPSRCFLSIYLASFCQSSTSEYQLQESLQQLSGFLPQAVGLLQLEFQGGGERSRNSQSELILINWQSVIIRMSVKELAGESKIFRTLFKQLKVTPQHPRSSLIEAINLLDENYYVLRRIQVDRQTNVRQAVAKQMDMVLTNSFDPTLLCRTIRYYTAWLECQMIAETAQTTQVEGKKETKPTSILSFIGKDKRKQKQSVAVPKLTAKESKRQAIYLYIQYESFAPLKIPKQSQRLNMACLIFVLSNRLLRKGIMVDLTLSNIAKDRDKRIKFLKKSANSTEYFNTEFLNLFKHIITGSTERQKQREILSKNPLIPEELRIKLTEQANNSATFDSLVEFMKQHQQIPAQVEMVLNEEASKAECSIHEDEIWLVGANNKLTFKLEECSFEFRKIVKQLEVVIRHQILEPVFLRMERGSFCSRFLKQIGLST